MSLQTSFVLTSNRFPNGTEVGLYPDSNWPNPGERSGEPIGEPIDTGTMEEGKIEFEGLGPNSLYQAVALIEEEYVYVSIFMGKIPSENATIIYGEGSPQKSEGEPGWLYIDVIDWEIWGPKDPDPEVGEPWGEGVPWALKAENDLGVHEAATEDVHGITNASSLVYKSELGDISLIVTAGSVEPGGEIAASWGAAVVTSKVPGEGEEEGEDGQYFVKLAGDLDGPAAILVTSGQSKRHVFAKDLFDVKEWEVSAEDFSGAAKDAAFNFVIIGG